MVLACNLVTLVGRGETEFLVHAFVGIFVLNIYYLSSPFILQSISLRNYGCILQQANLLLEK